jgi:hypothetical protein
MKEIYDGLGEDVKRDFCTNTAITILDMIDDDRWDNDLANDDYFDYEDWIVYTLIENDTVDKKSIAVTGIKCGIPTVDTETWNRILEIIDDHYKSNWKYEE